MAAVLPKCAWSIIWPPAQSTLNAVSLIFELTKNFSTGISIKMDANLKFKFLSRLFLQYRSC